MSEAKFTPGPWTEHMTEMARHGKSDLFYISAEDGEYIGKVKSKNARLIAAAPELYEAAVEVLSGNIIDFDIAWEKLKAAVAKAEGGAE